MNVVGMQAEPGAPKPRAAANGCVAASGRDLGAHIPETADTGNNLVQTSHVVEDVQPAMEAQVIRSQGDVRHEHFEIQQAPAPIATHPTKHQHHTLHSSQHHEDPARHDLRSYHQEQRRMQGAQESHQDLQQGQEEQSEQQRIVHSTQRHHALNPMHHAQGPRPGEMIVQGTQPAMMARMPNSSGFGRPAPSDPSPHRPEHHLQNPMRHAFHSQHRLPMTHHAQHPQQVLNPAHSAVQGQRDAQPQQRQLTGGDASISSDVAGLAAPRPENTIVHTTVMPASGDPGCSPAIIATIEPLLATRAKLLRSHRKATCWLFFKEVGVRPAATRGAEETLLACRICRPNTVDVTGWENVRGARGGLVRYSSTTGTSAMRTHVRNVHREECIAVERALAGACNPDDSMMAVSSELESVHNNPGMPNGSGPGSLRGIVIGDMVQSDRKRSSSILDIGGRENTASVDLHQRPYQDFKGNTQFPVWSSTDEFGHSKRRREETRNEILVAVQSLQSTIAEVSASLDALKAKVSALM